MISGWSPHVSGENDYCVLDVDRVVGRIYPETIQGACSSWRQSHHQAHKLMTLHTKAVKALREAWLAERSPKTSQTTVDRLNEKVDKAKETFAAFAESLKRLEGAAASSFCMSRFL
jgi:hypothetical protein